MLKKIVLLLLIILIPATLTAAPAAARPFPQHVTYAPGTIFPNHRTQTQLDDDVRAAYDRWKTAYVVSAGTGGGGEPLYRVTVGSGNPSRTVSEGQGFGMVITAHMAGHDAAAQTVFDGLWLFTRQHPSNINADLMAWEVPEPGGGADSAFDGDADIAYGLLLADAQWGSGGGIDYSAEATTVLSAIDAATIGPNSDLPMLGDWTDPNGSQYNEYTPRTSDFMPAYFRAWQRATGASGWGDVLAASQSAITTLQTSHSPTTGLLPDFVQPISSVDHTPRPADPFFLEGSHDGHMYYNAGRDPMRIGADALLNDDATSRAQVQKMANWVVTTTSGNAGQIKAGFHLDGTVIGNYYTTFFAAPLGVAVMTTPAHQAFLNDLYDDVYPATEDYYEDTVALYALLLMTGNFWDPTLPAAPTAVALHSNLVAVSVEWFLPMFLVLFMGSLSLYIGRSD